MKQRFLLLPVLMLLMSAAWATNYTASCIVPAGQLQCNVTFPSGPGQVALVQGDTLTMLATNGAGSVNLEYVFSGSPASVSITAAPCGMLGTCSSAVSTYTSTSNGNAGFELTQAYPAIKITVGTLSNGSSVKIGFSSNAVGTSSGGSGGGGNSNITQWNGTNLGSPSNYGTPPGAVEAPGVNAFVTNSVSVTNTPLTDLDSAIGTPGSATPAKSVQTAGTDGTNAVVLYIDPCQRGAKSYVSISLTANTQLISGTSSKKIYICDIHIVAAAATNVALVEGTGTTCGTSTAGMGGIGGATAATGWNLAANGGIVLGSGGFSVGAEVTAADNLCLFVSAANQISGGLSYVVY